MARGPTTMAVDNIGSAGEMSFTLKSPQRHRRNTSIFMRPGRALEDLLFQRAAEFYDAFTSIYSKRGMHDSNVGVRYAVGKMRI